jgi:hypothetical protein
LEHLPVPQMKWLQPCTLCHISSGFWRCFPWMENDQKFAHVSVLDLMKVFYIGESVIIGLHAPAIFNIWEEPPMKILYAVWMENVLSHLTPRLEQNCWGPSGWTRDSRSMPSIASPLAPSKLRVKF